MFVVTQKTMKPSMEVMNMELDVRKEKELWSFVQL